MKLWSALSVSVCIVGLVFGCGEVSKTAGTNTNWLERCTEDIECSVGSCLCGLCTRTCTTSSDCSGVGASECQSAESLECDAPALVCAPVVSAGGSAGSGGSAGASAGSGGTAGDTACEGFGDDAEWGIPVRILNGTNRTLYVGTDTVACGTPPLFTVSDERDTFLHGPVTPPCGVLCEGGGRFTNCPPPICSLPNTVTLEPGGGSVTLIWDGLYTVDRILPIECKAPELGPPSIECIQARHIEPGRYIFRARAGTELDCSQTLGTGTECPACEQSGPEGCMTRGGLISGELLETEVTVDLGPAHGVGLEPGDSSGPLLAVEISFGVAGN